MVVVWLCGYSVTEGPNAESLLYLKYVGPAVKRYAGYPTQG